MFDKKLSEENKNVTFTIKYLMNIINSSYEKDLDTDGVDKLAHCELNIFMCRNETKCKDQKL